MAKGKKKSSNRSSSTVDDRVVKQIKALLGIVVFIFIFASLFNQAGSIGGYVYRGVYDVIGLATPIVSLIMLWYLGHRFFPDKLPVRVITVVGVILFFLSFTGMVSSFDSAGGIVGSALYGVLQSALGLWIGRLLLFVLCFISLTLMLDKLLIVPFLIPQATEDQEEEESSDEVDTRVPVTGELKTGGVFKRIMKERLSKVEVKETEVVKKSTVSSRNGSTWAYPPVTLLEAVDMKPQAGNIQKRMELIEKTLGDFNIDVTMTDVNIGPTVSQYLLKPAEGVKLNAITARQDDLALALAAQSLRVEAPIPGKGLVGVEIPNEKKAIVGLRDIVQSKAFQNVGSKLAIVIGRDAAGEPAVADLTKMPHLLVAGATGSGKSVCINTMILSLLMNNSPDELRMVLVDPKRVELSGYNGLPHLLCPVITESRDTVVALKRAVEEMERRYKLLQATGKRNIEQYNAEPNLSEGRLPYIVIIIDELADLMMVSAREVESKIVRLAQMARAVGIHLIVATQRPSVDVITGLIKANIPTRIAFAVTSQIDSRTIIDTAGAEKLLGYGDMLYLSTDVLKPKRVQGAYCSEREINSVIAHIKQQEPGDRYDPSFLEEPMESRFGGGTSGGLDSSEEMLVREAYDLFLKHNKASTSMLQTYLRLGYNKAKRIVAAMEERGMIGPERGGKQREVYHVDGVSNEDTSVPVMETQDTGIAAYPENE